MLSISNLSKLYGAVCALRPLSLTLPQGGVTGLLGTQGSGKTTLLRLLAGELRPDTGTVWARFAPDALLPHRLENWEISNNKPKTRKWIAYVPENLTWFQKLRFRSKNHYIESIIRQKPLLLLIDEPYKDLAVTEKQVFAELMGICKKEGISVLLGSSDLKEVALLDRILYMEQGGILINDSPSAIFKRFATPILTIRSDDMPRLKQELLSREDVLDCHAQDQHLRVQFRGDPSSMNNAAQAGVSVMSMTAWLALKDHSNLEVKPAAPTLEDCFRMAVRR